jgi:hypothetical protein
MFDFLWTTRRGSSAGSHLRVARLRDAVSLPSREAAAPELGPSRAALASSVVGTRTGARSGTLASKARASSASRAIVFHIDAIRLRQVGLNRVPFRYIVEVVLTRPNVRFLAWVERVGTGIALDEFDLRADALD